jgi:hypothetical protein
MNYGGAVLGVVSLAGLGLARVKRPKFSSPQWAIVGVVGTFVLGVAMVHWPLLFDGGAHFVVPNVYDTPKHILALTAMRTADSWPPASPFMPSMGFAYNYGFYALPGYALSFFDDPSLAPQLYFWLVVGSTLIAVLSVHHLARVLGTSPKFQVAVVACSTWVGGLLPLLVKDPLAMGFRLYSERLVSVPIWMDDPFVSSIFVPQHLFASTCIVGLLVLTDGTRHATHLGVAGGLLCLAGSLSSLILTPHVTVAFGLCALVSVTMVRRSVTELGSLILCVCLCAMILLPFVLEAAEWQVGTNAGGLIGLPPLDWTLPLVALSAGPVLILAVAALPPLLTRRIPAAQMASLACVVVVAVAAVTLRYSEAPFKSMMLLRLLLCALSGLGLAYLWEKLKAPVARIGIVAALVGSAAINLPVVGHLAIPKGSTFAAADQALIRAIRAEPGPILFDGVIDQWLFALAGRPLIADFRPLRADAYLPPADRAAYARLFENSPEGQSARQRVDFSAVVAAPDNDHLWRARLGEPVNVGLGVELFRSRP